MTERPTGRPPRPRGRIEHGTVRGYFQHRRLNEPPCARCKKANTARSTNYRKLRRRQKSVIEAILADGRDAKKKKNKLPQEEFLAILRTIKGDLDACEPQALRDTKLSQTIGRRSLAKMPKEESPEVLTWCRTCGDWAT